MKANDRKRVFLIPADDLDTSIERALEAVKWRNEVRSNTTVLVKPNLAMARNVPGVNTNKELLRALVDRLKDRTEHVVIGESDSTSRKAEKVFRRIGDLGCELVNFSRDRVVYRQVRGWYLDRVPIPQSVVEADVLINVPLIKTHMDTLMTCCLKNLFGILPEPIKSKYHRRIDEVIADVSSVVKPDLNIVDGTYCMKGAGPTKGTIFKMDLVMAARDAICCDYVVCQLMGLDPSHVRHLMLSCRGDLSHFDGLEVVGDLDTFRRDFDLPKIGMLTKVVNCVSSIRFARVATHSPFFGPLARKALERLRA